MTVTFPPDLEASIQQKVASGRYQDVTEVIRAALRLLDQREQQQQALRASVADAFAAIERGEGVELTPELMDEIDREAEELARLGHPVNPDVCP